MEHIKIELTMDYSKIISVHGRDVKQTKDKLEANMKRKGLIE